MSEMASPQNLPGARLSSSISRRFAAPLRRVGAIFGSALRRKAAATRGKALGPDKNSEHEPDVLASTPPSLSYNGRGLPQHAPRYAAIGSQDTHTYSLFRIIGNDLPGRHDRGQSLANLRFTLENEPSLAYCAKRWILNRIFDKEREKELIDLLEANEQPFIRIPFRPEEYMATPWDLGPLDRRDIIKSAPNRVLRRAVVASYRHKNNYVMNNNGARNVAILQGRKHSTWILPWDGNCFVHALAWEAISNACREHSNATHLVVPMQRMGDNLHLLDAAFEPMPSEEPQIVFHRNADETFSEAFCYGRRSKVELLWRLGVLGPWDRWQDDPWDLPRPAGPVPNTRYQVAGWVARLASGNPALESTIQGTSSKRYKAREKAIVDTIDQLDHRFPGPHCKSPWTEFLAGRSVASLWDD